MILNCKVVSLPSALKRKISNFPLFIITSSQVPFPGAKGISLFLLNIPLQQKQISPIFGEGDFWILHVFLWVIFYKANTCVCVCKWVCACSLMSDSAAPWTIAYQAPLSMGFSRQEYWSGLPWPPSGDFPNPGIESKSLCLLHWQGDTLPTELSPSPCISLANSLES